MDAVIETRGLTKKFGDRIAVDSVDLTVPAGVAFGFLGPNGAGKTTLLRTLLGLTHATSGEVSLLGLPQPAKRPDALERVGLTGRANDRVKSYSLGMRQRLGIARCLLADPLLLILDEPMNGLDPAGILETRHLIRSFVDEGRTVFLSSHLLDEVEKTCDQVAIVDRGHVILQGAVAEIAAGGDPTLLVEVDNLTEAERLLSAEPGVATIEVEGTALRLTLADDLTPARVNALLVGAGLAVSRLEPARAT